jgi:hypothetical protein
MGLPKPSMTRPSSPGPTATRASSVRAARASPKLKAVDLFQRHGEHVAVAETDDLGANARPVEARISQKSPMATLGPRDSTSRPTTSVTTPVQRMRSMAVELVDIGREEIFGESASAGGRQAALDFLKLRSTEASRLPSASQRSPCRNRARGIADDFHMAEARLAQTGADQPTCAGMHPDAGETSDSATVESGEDQALQGFGIDGEFAVHDAFGDGQGEFDQVGFGLTANAITQVGEIDGGGSEALDDGLDFGGRFLAATARAFLQRGIGGLFEANLHGAFEVGHVALERGGIGAGIARRTRSVNGGAVERLPDHGLHGFLSLFAGEDST